MAPTDPAVVGRLREHLEGFLFVTSSKRCIYLKLGIQGIRPPSTFSSLINTGWAELAGLQARRSLFLRKWSQGCFQISIRCGSNSLFHTLTAGVNDAPRIDPGINSLEAQFKSVFPVLLLTLRIKCSLGDKHIASTNILLEPGKQSADALTTTPL